MLMTRRRKTQCRESEFGMKMKKIHFFPKEFKGCFSESSRQANIGANVPSRVVDCVFKIEVLQHVGFQIKNLIVMPEWSTNRGQRNFGFKHSADWVTFGLGLSKPYGGTIHANKGGRKRFPHQKTPIGQT